MHKFNRRWTSITFINFHLSHVPLCLLHQLPGLRVRCDSDQCHNDLDSAAYAVGVALYDASGQRLCSGTTGDRAPTATTDWWLQVPLESCPLLPRGPNTKQFLMFVCLGCCFILFPICNADRFQWTAKVKSISLAFAGLAAKAKQSGTAWVSVSQHVDLKVVETSLGTGQVGALNVFDPKKRSKEIAMARSLRSLPGVGDCNIKRSCILDDIAAIDPLSHPILQTSEPICGMVKK